MSRQPSAFPAPKTLGPVETYGANLQRSMSLMANSTGLKRNTVRILFYGQSITVAEWTKVVAGRLRRQYPLVDFVIENRAIPGFNAFFLEKTAEADLYPFYPDLVIFQNYDHGSGEHYENIIRRIRERTAADLLIATDHLAPHLGETMQEETDPLKLTKPKPGVHDAPWRNRVVLPAVAKQYGAELADVRALWKQYLNDHKLKPSDLLLDGLHLNAQGNYLMAEIILAHLRHRPDLTEATEDDRVKTYTIGEERDLQWKNGKLILHFEGNKIDLICKDGTASPAAIRIDGKKPSEFPELYVPSRVEMDVPRGYLIPPLLLIKSEKPRIVENWQIKMTGVREAVPRFRAIGSVTGDDGEGEVGKRFVSKSGRVVLDPDAFHLAFALQLSRNQMVDEIVASWRVVPYFADEFLVPATRNPFGDTVVIAAQGLSNGRHTLEITGGPDTPLAAIRVHRPPLARQ